MSFLLDLVHQIREKPQTHNDVMNLVVTGESLRGIYGMQDVDHPVIRLYDSLLPKWKDSVNVSLDEMTTYMNDIISEAHQYEPEDGPLALVMHPLSELLDLTRILVAGIRGGWWAEKDAGNVAGTINEKAASLALNNDATWFADQMWQMFHDPDYDIPMYEWVHTLAWESKDMKEFGERTSRILHKTKY